MVEILTPGDESYEKLGYYAELGVPEAWVIHRDTKQPEVYCLAGTTYELQAPDPQGWHCSRVTAVQLRQGTPGKLRIRVASLADSQEELPE